MPPGNNKLKHVSWQFGDNSETIIFGAEQKGPRSHHPHKAAVSRCLRDNVLRSG